MPTRYFAATASEGTPVVRSSASRFYTAASLVKYPNDTQWGSSWSSTRALAERVRWGGHAAATEVVDAREVTRAEYLRLKAEFEGTVGK